MGQVILKNKSLGGTKKIIFKFIDGKRFKVFDDLQSASKDAGVSTSTLANYMNKKKSKPKNIPENVEYSYTSKLITETEEW